MNEQEIVTSFLDQLPHDQQKISAAWKSLQAVGWDNEQAAVLSQVVHRLAGTALSIDFNKIGYAARNLENALKRTSKALNLENIENLYHYLEVALIESQENRQTTRQSEGRFKLQSIRQFAAHDLIYQPPRSESLIYLVEDDRLQAENLAVQIGYFGYTAKVFFYLSELREALHQAIPAAILMDIVFPEGELAGTEEILSLQKEFCGQLPVFFFSVRDDALARLQAVRAGGKGYFPKPVDVGLLIDEMDKVIVQDQIQTYRVLIVDDSDVQASINALHLKKAGMETQIINCSLDVLTALEDFKPDLLLLDLYLPDWSGLELASMIRQIKTFVSLPIVFLSAETNREKQLAAVGMGGDDFLTKPIKPDHLVSSVSARIERYRQIQALMLRDGLTGLYNHTTIRERLTQEAAFAIRNGTPLSIAILDLDHFKRVNDSHGHAAGDRVLKSLAHMLSRRLRQSDVVGRFGGEEFMIIFPNTAPHAALNIVDGLCDAFGQIAHIARGSEFRVTFSAGIAAFPQYTSAAALSEAADRALYAAKNTGRNRVVLAD